jgi:hypothetical protein
MKYLFFICWAFILSASTHAQENPGLHGTVKSFDGNAMPNATVILYYPGGKDSLKTVTNELGIFTFTKVNPGKITILVSYIGHHPYSHTYEYPKNKPGMTIDAITLVPDGNMLKNITLESQKVQIKEDTVSYLIDRTMYRKNDNVETLLKKLPGVQVDKDGTVTAQGKQVTKVKVNGKEFFNGDVTTATRELNADMVDKIQVIDDYGDQAAFTGIKDGDPSKTLNIQLKKDKNKGYFGNLAAGAGTEDRYLTSVSVNKFNNEQQLSLFANLNNTNASLFNFGSMGGAMGSMISGMMRGMGIGRSGGGVASVLGNLGNSDGISTTKSVGLNYRDQWGPRVSAYGSYSFSDRATNTLQEISQQNVFDGRSNTNFQNPQTYSVADNHRFSFNVEFKIDSMNYVKFTPTLSYRKTTTDYFSPFQYFDEEDRKLSDGNSADSSLSKSPNLNGNLLFNHRFKRKGRTLSVNLQGGRSGTEGNDTYQNVNNGFDQNGNPVSRRINQDIIQDNTNNNYGIRFSYTEPISKKKSLEFNYGYNRQFTGNDKETYLVNPLNGVKTFSDSLSNIYDNIYITHRFGVNYRINEKKYNYTFGLAVQPASIESNTFTGIRQSYTQHLVNYYPVVRFAYNFSKSRSFNINYNGSTSQPSYSQLQPVTDYSNPQYITIGNPNLKPEFTNTLSMRYNNFNLISGDVFFGNITFSFTKDKIVNKVQQLNPVVQKTSYLNSDGFYTAFGFYNISKPVQNRKYVFNLGGNITYNNNISFVEGPQNGTQKNTGRNWIFGQRFATDVKIKKWLETTVSVNYSLNNSRYSILKEYNSNSTGWTFSNSSRFFLPHDFILSYELDKTINSGFAENIGANPLLIGSTLEKQFLKKKNASFKLQAFDLLNENTGINRSVSGTAITDTRSNRLGRYFMLSFVLRLNKFSGQQPMMPGMPAQGGGMPMMRPAGL